MENKRGVGRPKGSGKGRSEALLVRFSPEELGRTQREAARHGQAASERIRLALAREAVLEAVNALTGDEESLTALAWEVANDLRAGKRDEWPPAALQRFAEENTKAALDRVRGAVKRLAEIENEFFSSASRAEKKRGPR